MPTPKHNVIYRVDPTTGEETAGVLLSNRKLRAWTSADAYERIVEEHGPRPWFINDNGRGQFYVRLARQGSGNPAMVSRLVLGVPPRKVIKYRDGDRLNLRPDNLVIGSSYSARQAKMSAMSLAAAPVAA